MSFWGKSITEILSDAAERMMEPPDRNGCTPNCINLIQPGSVEEQLEKVKTIFSDVQQEGRKQGYARAAEEYEDAFCRVRQEYEATQKILSQQMAEKDATASGLIAQLQHLEQKKEQLTQQLEAKTERVADRYDLPYSTVAGAAGCIALPGSSLIDLLYRYQNKRKQKYADEGYQEARALYQKKIRELTENLDRLKERGEKELQEIIGLIQDALQEISGLEAQITEMEIALQNE